MDAAAEAAAPEPGCLLDASGEKQRRREYTENRKPLQPRERRGWRKVGERERERER